MTLLLAGVLLCGGCARKEIVPEEKTAAQSQEVINFTAQTLRVNTKTDELNDNTSFNVDQSIVVFGRRESSGQKEIVFPANGGTAGTVVTKEEASDDEPWNYGTPQYWKWNNDSDFYDFLAAHPTGKGTTRMVDGSGNDIPGNMAIKTAYDINEDDYDLLYAARRRSGNELARCDTVKLRFHHLLTAVRVVVTNDSQSANFTLASYRFKNIVVKGAAKATIDGFGRPEFSWIDTQRKNSEEGVVSPSNMLYGQNSIGRHTYTGSFSLFIPFALDQTSDGSTEPGNPSDPGYAEALANYKAHLPQLIVDYGATEPAVVYLKDVQRDPKNGDTSLIGEWRQGIKYTYYISIRLDGGVVVSVVSTEWNEIKAETPGILI